MSIKTAPLIDKYFSGRGIFFLLKKFEFFGLGKTQYRVLFIQGEGAIGKTWLLRKMNAKALSMRSP